MNSIKNGLRPVNHKLQGEASYQNAPVPFSTSTEMQAEREKAAKERKTNEHFRTEMR